MNLMSKKKKKFNFFYLIINFQGKLSTRDIEMDKIRGRKRGKKSNKFIIQSKSGSWNKCINIANKY